MTKGVRKSSGRRAGRKSEQRGRSQRAFMERCCVGCRRRATRLAMTRVVCSDGRLVVDAAQRLPGRGSYVCPTARCVSAGLERKGFARTLRADVEGPSAQELVEQIIKEERAYVTRVLAGACRGGLVDGDARVVDSVASERFVARLAAMKTKLESLECSPVSALNSISPLRPEGRGSAARRSGGHGESLGFQPTSSGDE